MSSDMLKDTILEKIRAPKQGGTATIIELTGENRNQELLEKRILDIGHQSGRNTVVLKVNLIERSERVVKLFRVTESFLKMTWALHFPKYEKGIKNAILANILDELDTNRNLIIINFVTMPDRAEKLAEYLKYMKPLFWILRSANGGNDVFIIIREREVRAFKEELERIIGEYNIIDDMH